MSSEISSPPATAHPIRLRMLSSLTTEALSAAEIARELRITQANASYHLRLLASAGLVEEAGEETIRGGVAKRYRHPVADRRRSDTDDPEGTLLVWEAVAHELIRRAQEQRPGTSQLCDAELWVSPETWEE
ncbi:MAG TPA: helix-turn-helix domain-containing protein, partial [Actinopolymorphaceae bacterium]